MILNILSKQLGKDFDESGFIASRGKVNNRLLNRLNNIDYYHICFPKSLGKEYIDNVFLSIINSISIPTEDMLATFVEHIAVQIRDVFDQFSINNSLLTGGGVFNSYLIERIQHYTNTKLVIPNKSIINFKEAIIFGFLGVLKILNINNCLSSVTGANHDHSSGDIYIN